MGSNRFYSLLKDSKPGILKLIKYLILSSLIILLFIPLPDHKPTYSKVLYSKEGVLLSATISSEQQWCFPLDEDIPEKLSKCIIAYEDEYFAYHPGLNPVSIVKAAIINFKSGKIIRGASTIPMQVMRMKNKNVRRNWYNKLKETVGAVKYSLLNSDQFILREWCEIAPFGGNTIGIKAASLRYFGRPIEKLSWAEYALLAVMPNGPTSANLTNNRDILKRKRDFLLRKLQKSGHFEPSDLDLFLDEELPVEIKSIPQNAYHALLFMASQNPEKNIFKSTITFEQQTNVQDLLERESSFLKMDDIRNLAAVVIDVKNNQLLAYLGNVPGEGGQFSYVDIAQAPRSYGSLLKPLLYAYAIETAHKLPNEMVADIPTAIGDFQPENFDKKYRGAVPFEEMLIQSLNVPAVRVLNEIGLQNFYSLIRNLNIAYLNKGEDHYGLSIILGGGESSLWDMSRIYKGFAQNQMGFKDPFQPVQYLTEQIPVSGKNAIAFSGSTMDYLSEALSDLTRPREEKSWSMYTTDYKIAWKTGTSYGHRDAWALGYNGKYMVGIWIGNEDGEGRFDLTGISKAAPVMFKVFNILPENQWFSTTSNQQKKEVVVICTESGKLAGPLCKNKHKIAIGKISYKYSPCQYHQEVLLNSKGLTLSENCVQTDSKRDTLFVLPSYMEYYYKTGHSDYTGLPEHDPSCQPANTACSILYPYDGLKVFLPKENINKQNELILKAYHREKDAQLFWFIDNDYKKTTISAPHNCLIHVNIGTHILTITDKWGNRDQVKFEVLGREE